MKAFLHKWRRRNAGVSKVYIVPTVFGAAFALSILGLIFYGVIAHATAAVGTGLLLFLLSLLAMVETHVNVREVGVELDDVPPCEAGVRGFFRVRLNAKEPAWGLIVEADKERSFRQLVSFWHEPLHMEPGSCSAELTVGPLPRGFYRCPAVVVASYFPFGLFRAWKTVPVAGMRAVYPAARGPTFALLRSEVRACDTPMDHSLVRERNREDSEFKEHKEWIVGDSTLRIDWRASMRRGVKLIRVFEDQSQKGMRSFAWKDTYGANDEQRLEQISKWVNDAEAENLSYRLELPDITVPYGNGEKHWRSAMVALASFKMNDPAGTV